MKQIGGFVMRLLSIAVSVAILCTVQSAVVAFRIASATVGQSQRSLTPLQLAIERERERLKSASVEDRRDALMRLRAMRREEASRAAAPALADLASIVRATAVPAGLSLP